MQLIDTESNSPVELSRIVNVMGRFKKIDFDRFIKVILQFEAMCRNDYSVSISDLNTFLEGIVLSKLHNSDVVVKRTLTNHCPNL